MQGPPIFWKLTIAKTDVADPVGRIERYFFRREDAEAAMERVHESTIGMTDLEQVNDCRGLVEDILCLKCGQPTDASLKLYRVDEHTSEIEDVYHVHPVCLS